MRKPVIALIGSALVPACTMLVAAAPAHAEPPGDLPPQPVPDEFVDGRCGFDVLVQFEGKQAAFEAGGRLHLIAPGSRATLTNLETGASVTVNAAGPGTVTETPTADGGLVMTLEARGNWTHAHPDTILSTSGPWTETLVFDADGNLVGHEEDLSGARVVDLCAALS